MRIASVSALATGFAAALWLIASSSTSAQVLVNPTTVPNLATRPAPQSFAGVAEPRVLIISIDGLRPDCLLRAEAPNLRALMARGSFTMHARTTDIAVTTPSHISMLTGVTPERHGIVFNSDPPDDARILVPTLFDIAHDAGLSTGMAAGKSKFVLFDRTKKIDFATITTDPVSSDAFVGDGAEEIIRRHKPRVMVVHFPGVDVTGHSIGWGTREQLETIAKVDLALGGVLQAVEDAGVRDSTYIIISADHGGSMRTHGRGDVKSRYIPWIFAGPGVRANYDLTRLGRDYDIATYDTFSTACHVLGLPIPADSDGKAITPAFESFDLLEGAPAAKPTTSPTTRP